ncbi:conjugal transfer protein TraB [Streptomyces sp. NPDC000971]|uniref:conjugal transfer protein TraB n=1 Tax=Streptomyces sp. NPDC000971 TaxID=3156647 RepID=UPI003333C67C
MSSELSPRPTTTPAPADGDNRYKSVQLKLKKLAAAMDASSDELGALQREMRANAERTEALAVDIANAHLDTRFVELTNTVAIALGGAAHDVRKLHQSAQDVAQTAHETQRTHSTLYSALDDIRSSRKERTPKPGFFAR